MLSIILYIALIGLGGYMAYSQLQKDRRCSQPATGTVVGRDTMRVRGAKGRRTRHYAPVVEFIADGQTVRVTADVDSIFAGKFKDGDALEISYNPQNAEEMVAKGKSFRSNVLGGGLLILLGLLGLYLRIR